MSDTRTCKKCGEQSDEFRDDPRWHETCAECYDELTDKHGEVRQTNDGWEVK